MSLKNVLMGASALMATGLITQPAFAQTTAAAAAAPTDTAVGEVIVQARSRRESIVDVPLSISVVSNAKLEQLDIKSTTDLVNYTPGVTFNNYTVGDGRNDRGGDRPIVIRGLNLGIGNSAGAGMFLDGAAVVGNEIPADLDIGQVEVLRGPQSVYFGRATTTGAISYRTRSISNPWSSEFVGTYGSQGERDLEATVAGAIIPDVLRMRLTGLTNSFGGYVTNQYNNTMLGATTTNSISGTVIFNPTPTVEFKGYANYFREDDGPAATAFITSNYDNCTLPGAIRTTFCGQIPGRQYSQAYANTTIPASISSVIFSTPLIQGQGFQNKIGQQSAVLNTDLVGNWDINSYLKLTEISAYHKNVTDSASDGIQRAPTATMPYQNYMYTYATFKEDLSQEIRLASDPNQRFSWTIGGNYIRRTTIVSAFVGWVPTTGAPFSYKQPIIPSIAETVGVFGGIYYKITDKLTFSGEARRQSDHITAAEGTDSATFISYSPRVALDYDIGGHRKIYASFAQGTQPGGFNTSVDAYKTNAAAYQQIQQIFGVSSDYFKEEQISQGELGVKGNFAGGKGFFDFDGYYGVLTNQQINQNAPVPALGFSVSVTNNAGKSTIYGLEGQGSYNFDSHFSIFATYAWNHTERNSYLNVVGGPEFGTTNFNGKSFAYVPEFSGSVVLNYEHEINQMWGGYGNVAVTYRGKQFADEFNASYIPQRFQLDLRTGVTRGQYKLEIFVKNLLNDQNYTGGSVAPDYAQSAPASEYYGFFGGWAPPRQIGARVLAKF